MLYARKCVSLHIESWNYYLDKINIMENQISNPVQDYWKFTRELKSQFDIVRLFERQFFELDDQCEWSVKNNVTFTNEKGERVSILDDYLNARQKEVYERLRIETGNLYDMLSRGRGCFNLENA